MLYSGVVTFCLFAYNLAADVQIDNKSPILKLLLLPDSTGSEVTKVTFNYGVKNVIFRHSGIRTSKGWEVQDRGVSLDGADDISADAEIIYADGRVVRTPKSTLTLGDALPVFRLPSRRIRGAVVFRDDFNTFNLQNWKHIVSMYGGYNGEFQVYTNDPQNSFTRNGYLYIKPTLTISDPRFDVDFLHNGTMDMVDLFGKCSNNHDDGCHREGKDRILPPAMSARIDSVPGITYGVIEVRARIPTGDWLWPAIWMRPRRNSYGGGGWPKNGEMDIMESRGNAGPNGVGKVQTALHWGPDSAHDRFHSTAGKKMRDPTWADGFHVWRLEWTPDHIVTYVDNEQIMYVDPGHSFWEFGNFSGTNIWASGGKMAPFDREFFMTLNVAVGGTSGMFSDNYMVNKPWKNNSPTAAEDFWNGRALWEKSWVGNKVAMLIDYVEMRHL